MALSGKVKEQKSIQMVIPIQVNYKKERSMVKESLHMQMVHLTKESSKMTNSRQVKEYKSMKMEISIPVKSKMEIDTVKES